jgi:hypothetical protein
VLARDLRAFEGSETNPGYEDEGIINAPVFHDDCSRIETRESEDRCDSGRDDGPDQYLWHTRLGEKRSSFWGLCIHVLVRATQNKERKICERLKTLDLETELSRSLQKRNWLWLLVEKESDRGILHTVDMVEIFAAKRLHSKRDEGFDVAFKLTFTVDESA